MNESKRVQELKQDSLNLFNMRDNFQEYESKAIEIANKVHDFKLEHIIDPGQLRFFLVNPVGGKKLSDIGSGEFRKSVEEYFKLKNIEYYFQLVQLGNFPSRYKLGHGTLLTFDLLPQLVKTCATNISKGKVSSIAPSIQKVWRQIIPLLAIPVNPRMGHWLRISVSAISSSTSLERAFEYAEESLDILRMAISTARFRLPQHAVAHNQKENKAFPVAKQVELSKYNYNPRHHNLIDRLNTVYIKGSSELESRIKNAIHFYRIGDNNSPDYQKLFFYVAAIENLILGSNDRDVLRWKFSEKGAILLSDNLKQRLDLSTELKRLYDARSSIAHGRMSDYDFLLATSSRSYLRRAIIRIMDLVDRHQLKTVTQNEKRPGQSLDEYLNNIIYTG
jgi:hypothetical protein